jgi:hypothetical protein
MRFWPRSSIGGIAETANPLFLSERRRIRWEAQLRSLQGSNLRFVMIFEVPIRPDSRKNGVANSWPAVLNQRPSLALDDPHSTPFSLATFDSVRRLTNGDLTRLTSRMVEPRGFTPLL